MSRQKTAETAAPLLTNTRLSHQTQTAQLEYRRNEISQCDRTELHQRYGVRFLKQKIILWRNGQKRHSGLISCGSQERGHWRPDGLSRRLPRIPERDP